MFPIHHADSANASESAAVIAEVVDAVKPTYAACQSPSAKAARAAWRVSMGGLSAVGVDIVVSA